VLVPSCMKPYLDTLLARPHQFLVSAPFNARLYEDSTLLGLLREDRTVVVRNNELGIRISYKFFTKYAIRKVEKGTLYDYAHLHEPIRVYYVIGALELFFGVSVGCPWGHAFYTSSMSNAIIAPTTLLDDGMVSISKLPMNMRRYVYDMDKWLNCPMMLYLCQLPTESVFIVVYAPYGSNAHVAYSLLGETERSGEVLSLVSHVMSDFHLFNALYPSYIDDDFFTGLARSQAKELYIQPTFRR
jgi:hypothetical protein